MKGFIATEDIWKKPMRLWNILLSTHLWQVLSSQVTVWPQKSLFCRQEFLCCLQKPLYCLQKSLFCLQKSSLARASFDTQHDLARRIDCGWELSGRRPGGGLVRQWSTRKWWIQRPRQGRLIISYQGRSRAGFLPSFLPVLHVRWRPLSHRPSLISPCVVFETNPALFAFSNHN